jgi:peptide/nickel transport system permease protein
MLAKARNFLGQARGRALWPGAAILMVVMGCNLMGDGLRDALDPKEN